MSIVLVVESCAHCKSIASFQCDLWTGSTLITLITDTMPLQFVITVVLLYCKYAKIFFRTGAIAWLLILFPVFVSFFQIALDTIVKVIKLN